MAAGDGIIFTGRVTKLASLELDDGVVFRNVVVDLGDLGNVSFSNYTKVKDGGVAFVKLDDLVQVRLEVLGASPYDAG